MLLRRKEKVKESGKKGTKMKILNKCYFKRNVKHSVLMLCRQQRCSTEPQNGLGQKSPLRPSSPAVPSAQGHH